MYDQSSEGTYVDSDTITYGENIPHGKIVYKAGNVQENELPNEPFSKILTDRDPSEAQQINSFDKDKNLRLEEEIKLHHLEQLMNKFTSYKPDDILIHEGTGFLPPKTQPRPPGQMNLEEFKETVSDVLGTDEYNEYLDKLFQKLDTSSNGYVDWNEFSTYLLLLYRENDYMRTKREIPFSMEPKIRHIVQNRQEQTSKIVSVQGPTRYVTISREGAISVWYPSLMFEKHYIIDDDDPDQSGQKRRFKMWVTDAIYMPNCNKIAIASTSRDIRFFDVSTSHYFEEFHLFALPDVPNCFDYWYDKKNPNSDSMLLFGNDMGSINILTFYKPVTQLFDIPFKNDSGAQKIFMQNLEQHSKWVSHMIIQDVHPEQIRQIMYLPESNTIISSCSSPHKSVVISHMQKKMKPYTFKIDKGVEAFDFNKNLNIMVTGSLDHAIRIWNPYVTVKPTAVMTGHATGVIAVKIHEGLMQVFSYSKDAVVKVWDIKEHACLQTTVLKFPSSIHGRMPEHGQFPMHLQPAPQNVLLVTCNDYLGLLKLGHVGISKSVTATTHDTQLCCAIYNSKFRQVATGCDSSAIALWDIETGNKSVMFSNAHEDEEITCMTFDRSYRRLFTGARNGTIKVWNFQNGHNLHKLEPVAEAEVTGIYPHTDRKVIIAVGWSRKMAIYDDADPDNMYVPAQCNWKGGQLHQDDILTMDYCPPNFLVTASFDGEIIVWDVETEKIFVRLRKGQPSDIGRNIEELKSGIVTNGEIRPKSLNSRPNSRHRKAFKIMAGQIAPVDKVLFLKSRGAVRHSESATLVSSEGGVLRWWCLYGAKHEMGEYYAPDNHDESILGMCTDSENRFLFTGDTQGNIQVWDISKYCTKAQEKKVNERPPLEASWKAHDSAIVSLEYVQHPTGEFILSASTDKTARLWTLKEGEFIGTFGQKKSWNLKDRTTWAHPRTPWTPTEISHKENGTEQDRVSALEEANNLKEDNEEFIPPEDRKDDEKEKEEKVPISDLIHTKQNSDITLKKRTTETFLGTKVEKELSRKQQDRRDRRENYGGITMKKTQQYGKLCSPFQALSTPEVKNPELPKDLPLSQRMLSKGYKSENITDEKLINMDFSYASPETPSSEQQENKKTVPGSHAATRDDKSRASKTPSRSKQSTPSISKLSTPSLMKQSTSSSFMLKKSNTSV
ncbi:hypothetical protein CHS0354_025521 [Potamilus streckersoni]|uniref:EF-hand domain-containing protein n=2 Tax=Potamilus streckersoni TaxID=2493646 RepID=A0AAE0SKI1_9BIVA|nr:hypothetical protein CHS0354_025521 [Potamilus streckersoni]